MLFVGKWAVGSDGITRPIVLGEMPRRDGTWLSVPFLLNTGADATVLTNHVLRELDLPSEAFARALVGIGGGAESVCVRTRIVLLDELGTRVNFRGVYSAFTDLGALDISVLGRDVTAHFAVLVDRPGDRLCLVHPPHGCTIGIV